MVIEPIGDQKMRESCCTEKRKLPFRFSREMDCALVRVEKVAAPGIGELGVFFPLIAQWRKISALMTGHKFQRIIGI